MVFDINFIAYAVDLKIDTCYEDFLIPFTFFSLLFNKNSHVEIIVLDPDKFKRKYNKEIASIKQFNENFLIRKPQYILNRHIPNTYRFFEVPTIKSKYTYISDVDIVYLEELLPKYLSSWPNNLPYHNILRPNLKYSRLTGLMMVINNKYYTDGFKKCQKKHYDMNVTSNDEVILCKMCKEIHGLPDNNFQYRPVLGIHFSPNRGENKTMPLRTYTKYKDAFLDIATKYPNLFTYPIFNKLLTQLKDKFDIED